MIGCGSTLCELRGSHHQVAGVFASRPPRQHATKGRATAFRILKQAASAILAGDPEGSTDSGSNRVASVAPVRLSSRSVFSTLPAGIRTMS